MILDTSAVFAIVLGEEFATPLLELVLNDGDVKLSAATAVEISAVATRKLRPEQSRRLQRLLEEWQVAVVPFDEHQAELASQAYSVYGKGSRHPAQLNLGDCFSYALATALNEPLLFVGNDFVHTDVTAAFLPENA